MELKAIDARELSKLIDPIVAMQRETLFYVPLKQIKKLEL